MTCPTCEKFPVPADRFSELSVSQKRHGTLYCCLDCGQLIEITTEERSHRYTSVMDTMFDYDYQLPFIRSVSCKKCGASISPRRAIESAPYSWPHLNAIWHVCPECGNGNHVVFRNGEWGTIEVWGAPGPSVVNLQRVKSAEIKSINEDGSALKVFIEGKWHVVDVRK
jgi:RNase P subunit RPR2